MKKGFGALMLFCVVYTVALVSCNLGNDCGKAVKMDYRTVNLEVKNLKLEEHNSSAQTYSFKAVAEGEELKFHEYFWEIYFKKELFSQKKANLNSSIMSSAFACDPVIPDDVEELLSITVISNSDFNNEYPKGTDLSPILDVLVAQISSEIKYERLKLKDFIDSKLKGEDLIYLVFNTPPSVDQLYQFEVTMDIVYKGVEKSFTQKTPEIKLKAGL
jgi:hypothetical protein